MNKGILRRTSGRAALLGALVLLAVAASWQPTEAQSYSSGQNVSPAYEGWERDPDGTRYFVFGYMNRNWQEELTVPIGPENRIEPGGPDRGQPTRFLPRRNRFTFRVAVPAGFSETDEMIWTLTTRGKEERAFATLRPDYFMDDVVVASETGALGAGTSNPEIRGNKPPVVRVEGQRTRTVKVGDPLTLTAVVTDDGVPKPRRDGFGGAAVRDEEPAAGRGAAEGAGGAGRGAAGERGGAAAGAGGSSAALLALFGRGGNPAYNPVVRVTVGKTVGLHLSWFVYRGPGDVRFEPAQVKVWEDTRTGANSPWAPLWTAPPVPADGKYVATAVFSEPGTYVLRARADDGALFHDQDVTVTVTR
jgi:hypothetical protein